LRLQSGPGLQVGVASFSQHGDGGLDFCSLGGFLLECLLVRGCLDLQDLDVLFLHALILCVVLSKARGVAVRSGERTLKLHHVHAELVALL